MTARTEFYSFCRSPIYERVQKWQPLNSLVAEQVAEQRSPLDKVIIVPLSGAKPPWNYSWNSMELLGL